MIAWRGGTPAGEGGRAGMMVGREGMPDGEECLTEKGPDGKGCLTEKDA